jgi:hypothetical protein
MALLERKARAKGHVAHVGRPRLGHGRQLVDVMIGADALHRAHRPGPKARAGAVGHAQVHGHADNGDLQPAEIGQVRRIGVQRQVEEGRDAGVGFGPAVAREQDVDDLAELLVLHLRAGRRSVFRAQTLQFCLRHGSAKPLRWAS